MSQGRKQLKLVNALKGEHAPVQHSFLICLLIIGIAPYSVHQVLSHCYSVHPILSMHHPRLYPYQSSILTLQDSLARILLYRVRGCDPCTLHIDTLLNPTSNLVRSLHLWHPHPWQMGRYIFMWAPSSWCHSTSSGMSWSVWPVRPGWYWGKLSIMNSCCSQTHSLEKVKGTEGIKASGLSDAYYVLGLWRADRSDGGWSELQSPDASFGGELPGESNQKGCWGHQINMQMSWVVLP